MRLALTIFSHTFSIDAGITCPDHGQPDREVDMGSMVEHADTEPDRRAELDARVRPDETFGFRQMPTTSHNDD